MKFEPKVIQMMRPDVLKAIIKGSRRGKNADMERLYKYSYVKLLNVAVRYTSNISDAQWYFNMAMLNVFKSLKKYDSSRAYLPWARTLIIRSCIDQLRQKQALHVPLDEANGSYDNVEDNADFNLFMNTMDREDVIHQIRMLNDRQRTVFSLYAIDGYSHKEIEQLTGIKSNTSKWLLAEAKRSLKSYLSTHANTNENAI